jgi:hypothetical protein
MEPGAQSGCYAGMLDFPVDPELRIHGSPQRVLRRTNEAEKFVRQMVLRYPDGRWRDVLQSFQAIQDEWSAIEAVVDLELLLEAEGRLIDELQPRPPSAELTGGQPRVA